jgi:hypothetical protein
MVELSRMDPDQQDMMDWNWEEPVRERENSEPCWEVGAWMDVENIQPPVRRVNWI